MEQAPCVASPAPTAPRRLAWSQVRAFQHQVGGHGVGDLREGIKLYKDWVLKPLVAGDGRSDREHAFYRSIAHNPLRPFVPGFGGLVQLCDAGSQVVQECLCMENVLAGLAMPCVMDLKLGTRTYSPAAGAAKVAYEISKWPWQEAHGFRTTGMQLTNPTTGEMQSDQKIFKKMKTEDSVVESVGAFLRFCTPMDRQALLHQLDLLLEALRASATHRCFAASLLIVYDAGGASAGEAGLSPSPSTSTSTYAAAASTSMNDRVGAARRRASSTLQCYLIDFGHTYTINPGERDEGMIHGVRNIRSIFQRGAWADA